MSGRDPMGVASSELAFITLDGKKYVCGLFWQSFSNKRTSKAEIKEAAKLVSADYFIQLRAQIPQCGFGSSRDQLDGSCASLAAAVFKSMGEVKVEGRKVENWIAAFEFPDGRWGLFAARQSAIHPDGDCAGSKADIQKKMGTTFAEGHWDKVYVPADWGYSGSEERVLREILPMKGNKVRFHRWWLMRPLKLQVKPKHMILGAIAAALAFAAIQGYSLYNKQQIEAARQAGLAEIAAMQAKRQKDAALTVQDTYKPWQANPQSADFVPACLAALTSDVIAPGGWTLKSMTCSPTNVVYAWDRGKAVTSDLVAAVDGVVIDPASGDRASVLRPLTVATPLQAEEAIDANTAVPEFYTGFQSLGVKAGLTIVPPPAPTKNNPNPPAPAWKHYKWQATSDVPPVALLKSLGYPGARVTKITMTPDNDGNQSWAMEGDFYAR